MKKRIIKWIIGIGILMSLTACSVHDVGKQAAIVETKEHQNVTVNSQELLKESEDKETTNSEKPGNSYKEILELYHQALYERQTSPEKEVKQYYSKHNLSNSILEPYWAWESTENIQSKEGFAFLDLNDDGVEELLLGWVGNEFWNMDKGYVFAVYTLIDGEAVLAIEGWERCLYVIGEDGYLYQNGSSSAWEGTYTKYRFNPEYEDFLEPIEEIYSYMGTEGDVCWKYIINPVDIGSEEELKKNEADTINEEDALTMGEGWIASGMKLEYTLFSEYGEKLVFLEDNDLLVAGEYYVAIVDAEGNIQVAYAKERADEEVLATRWEKAVKLAETKYFPVGISEEGKLLIPNGRTIADYEQDIKDFETSGGNGGMVLGMRLDNATEMSGWEGLVQMHGDYSEMGALGIFADGSVKEAGLVGTGLTEAAFTEIQAWEEVKDFATTYYGSYVAGLMQNGEVKLVHDDAAEAEVLCTNGVTWDNIVALESGTVMFFGLTEEGKVLHTKVTLGQDYTTEAMEDIVFIAAGYNEEWNCDMVYGIRKDGKVVDHFGKEVTGLEDVVEIAVTDFFPNIVIGRKTDGTICISDNADDAMKQAVAKWNKE
ncbi:MAG: hypothetical protein IJ379_06480 [Lachnospiraceae bacterium]|nr:hypothetical protein [Lachnospiraceae bacterium]